MKTRRTDDAGDMIDARGAGGMGRTATMGAGGLGLTGILIVLALQLLSGGKFEVPAGFDPSAAVSAGSAPVPSSKEEDSLAAFSGRVAADDQARDREGRVGAGDLASGSSQGRPL